MRSIRYGRKSTSIDSGNMSTIQEVEVPVCKNIRKTYCVTVIYVRKSAEEVEAKRSVLEDLIKRTSNILKE